jgi:hypothetical protein
MVRAVGHGCTLLEATEGERGSKELAIFLRHLARRRRAVFEAPAKESHGESQNLIDFSASQ